MSDKTRAINFTIPIAYKAIITPAEEACRICNNDKLHKLELVEIFDKSDKESEASYYNSIKFIEMARDMLNDKGLSSFETDNDNLAIKMIFITTFQTISNIMVSEFMQHSDIGKMTISELAGILAMSTVSDIRQKYNKENIDFLLSLDPNNPNDITNYAKSQGDISVEAAKMMLEIHQNDIRPKTA